ncbi:MAG TPA: DUF4331 family protein [Polyangia bacterium]|jgi:hypothetical protein|nr:DUF4331 family protein [Polyangia bacterium]
MRNSKATTNRMLLGMALLGLAATACGSSSNNNGKDGGGNNPAPPALGGQVDRQGRSVVNTVLIHGFDSDAAATMAAKDAYNAAAPATWGSFKAEIAKNLAILDSLDTMCGNQLLAGPTVAAGRYDALAGVLADDQLYVNTATGTCTQYFAVELGMAGDCGGRAPTYDTIDVTLSAAAIGMPSGVTDGISADDKTQSKTTFPFLAD